MDVSIPAAVLMSLAVAALIGFVLYKNRLDRKALEEKLKDDYHKPSVHHGESDEIDEHT